MTRQQGKANILLVEDEENLHDALKLNLELEGYEITSAYDGNEALKAIKDEYFDLIIMDVMLPHVDGISVTETIRIQNNEVPVLILSAKNTSADRVLGLKKGADDYMVKPFNLEELLLRVEKLILKNKKLNDKETIGDTYEYGDITYSQLPEPLTTSFSTSENISKRTAEILHFFNL
jgi:two-component system alkaline phosphatase synthesis response regulator PhoP